MKIKWLIEERILQNHGILKPGQIYDLPELIATQLIQQGDAVVASKAKKKMKMVDRTEPIKIENDLK